MIEKSIKRNISASILLQVIFVVISGVIGIAIVPVIIRHVGKITFGILELILTLELINAFFEFGFGSTVVKYTLEFIRKDKNEFNTFIWTFIYIKIILSVIVVFIVLLLGLNFEHIFKDIPDQQVNSIRISIVIYCAGLLLKNFVDVFDNILRGIIRYDLSIIANLSSRILYFFIVFLLFRIKIDAGIIELSFLSFIITPLSKGVLIGLFFKKLKTGFNIIPQKFSKIILSKTFHFMGGISLISIIAQVYNQGIKFVLGMISNPLAVAYFGIANRIRSPILQIDDSILRPLIPAGTVIWNTESRSSEIVFKYTRLQASIIIGLSVFILAFITKFIHLWLGEGYKEVSTIITIFVIPFVLPSFGVLLMFYYATGKTKLSMYLNTLNTICALFLSIILQKYFGLIGFVIGISITQIIISIMGMVVYCREYRISIIDYLKYGYGKIYLILIFLSLFLFILLKYIEIDNWFKFLFISGITGILYLFLLVIFIYQSEYTKFKKYLILSFKRR